MTTIFPSDRSSRHAFMLTHVGVPQTGETPIVANVYNITEDATIGAKVTDIPPVLSELGEGLYQLEFDWNQNDENGDDVRKVCMVIDSGVVPMAASERYQSLEIENTDQDNQEARMTLMLAAIMSNLADWSVASNQLTVDLLPALATAMGMSEEIAAFNLADASGDPTSENPFARALVSLLGS
jgi:hypothetical protein